jgi:hypothetical protein
MPATPAEYLDALRVVLAAVEARDWAASEKASIRCDQISAELRAGKLWLDRAQLDEASALHARCMAAATAGAARLREKVQESTQTRVAIAAYAQHSR